MSNWKQEMVQSKQDVSLYIYDIMVEKQLKQNDDVFILSVTVINLMWYKHSITFSQFYICCASLHI